MLKWCVYQEDTTGDDYNLTYYRDREKREVDFIIQKNRKPIHFIETKVSDTNISSSFFYLKSKYPEVKATQVVYRTHKEYSHDTGIQVLSAERFLSEWI